MYFKDRFMEFVLSLKDWVLNAVSGGLWGRWYEARLNGKWGLK